MTPIYLHLSYEEYKALEKQMRAFAETSHKTEGGFYHKSIRLKVSESVIMEFHGPLVGGYGHRREEVITMTAHETHQTRLSDSSLYDEVCIRCGATDGPRGTLKVEPCPFPKSP